MRRSAYEGLQGKIKKIKAPGIGTFKNIYPDRDYCITIDIPEFTCICPKTALPDFAVITVRYIPDRLCLELKSLKYYELSYRSLGIFHENVVNRFLDDLVEACSPRWMEVTGEFNARGGIKTVVKAEYKKG
ncbi:Nitrile oxidoreductase, NADPH-dependent, QueF [sediment metagenome]|uniref:Nitrile oxidoreductase, NADPH-dependent, QueF n=1 Tax=sediment metagenome TaxID=749907 RepID=D9PIC1_9ZZZZ